MFRLLYSFLRKCSYAAVAGLSSQTDWFDVIAITELTWAEGVCFKDKLLLFSSFRRVSIVICSFLGNSPASEF